MGVCSSAQPIAGSTRTTTGGTALSRAATNDAGAFLGWGPEHDEPDTGPGVTGLGLFLFVSLPLFVAGGVLYGYG